MTKPRPRRSGEVRLDAFEDFEVEPVGGEVA